MQRLFIIIKNGIRTPHLWQKGQMILCYWKRCAENTKSHFLHLVIDKGIFKFNYLYTAEDLV